MGPEDRQFPEFFTSQHGRLRRLGFLLTGDWGEGEELAQETLVRVYWRWSLVRHHAHPEAYARKVLVNRHRSLLRRLRLEASHAGRERAETVDLGPREELLVVREAIRRLPVRQRTVLVLRYHEDLPEREVARLLRVPVGTVKSLGNRAMARLRQDLAGSLPTARTRGGRRREPGGAGPGGPGRGGQAEPDEAGADAWFRRRRRARPPPRRPAWPSPWCWPWPSAGALVVGGGRGDERPDRSSPRRPPPPRHLRAAARAGRDHPARPAAGGRLGRRSGPGRRQGFELTLPRGWKVDQSTTRSYAQFGQPWLVISPAGGGVGHDNRRITIFTAVTSGRVSRQGRQEGPDLKGQSFSPVRAQVRDAGRRPGLAIGDQGGARPLRDRLAYRCASGTPCPDAGRGGSCGWTSRGPAVRKGGSCGRSRRLVDSIRPITNALPPTRATVAEESGLFADAPVVVGRGGQGDYAWEVLARKGSVRTTGSRPAARTASCSSARSYTEQRRAGCLDPLCAVQGTGDGHTGHGRGVRGGGQGRARGEGMPSVEVPTFRKKGFLFTFWVVAPLPPDARPRSFTSFDAAGQRIARGPGSPATRTAAADRPRWPGGTRTRRLRGPRDLEEELWTQRRAVPASPEARGEADLAPTTEFRAFLAGDPIPTDAAPRTSPARRLAGPPAGVVPEPQRPLNATACTPTTPGPGLAGRAPRRPGGLWLVFWRKASGRTGLTYEEAVEEALCFGWIDGKAGKPRRPADDAPFARKRSGGGRTRCGSSGCSPRA